MRYLLLLVLSLISLSATAAHVKCYSEGKEIYSHSVKDMYFDGEAYVFTEISTGYLVFTNAVCIFKMKV